MADDARVAGFREIELRVLDHHLPSAEETVVDCTSDGRQSPRVEEQV